MVAIMYQGGKHPGDTQKWAQRDLAPALNCTNGIGESRPNIAVMRPTRSPTPHTNRMRTPPRIPRRVHSRPNRQPPLPTTRQRHRRPSRPMDHQPNQGHTMTNLILTSLTLIGWIVAASLTTIAIAAVINLTRKPKPPTHNHNHTTTKTYSHDHTNPMPNPPQPRPLARRPPHNPTTSQTTLHNLPPNPTMPNPHQQPRNRPTNRLPPRHLRRTNPNTTLRTRPRHQPQPMQTPRLQPQGIHTRPMPQPLQTTQQTKTENTHPMNTNYIAARSTDRAITWSQALASAGHERITT